MAETKTRTLEDLTVLESDPSPRAYVACGVPVMALQEPNKPLNLKSTVPEEACGYVVGKGIGNYVSVQFYREEDPDATGC
jgi:hypothetical protein